MHTTLFVTCPRRAKTCCTCERVGVSIQPLLLSVMDPPHECVIHLVDSFRYASWPERTIKGSTSMPRRSLESAWGRHKLLSVTIDPCHWVPRASILPR